MANRYAVAHRAPKGPGDARPTAKQIVRDETLENSLLGRVVLITGCSSGIGLETARAMFLTGATLYLTTRDLNKTQSALEDIIQSGGVHLLELDLDSLASVRSCVAEFLSKSETLDILILNAGLMTPKKLHTRDGFEMHFGANYLANFLLFSLLQPALKAAATADLASRVIVLTSIVHRFAEVNFDDVNAEQRFDGMTAYGASKTALIWMANEIERRFGSEGIHAWSVQPGAVLSELNRHMSEEQRSSLRADPFLTGIYKNPEQGAATSVWAAISTILEGQGGQYLEDVQIAEAWKPAVGRWGPGYAPHAFDVGKAKELWEKSLKWTDNEP